MPLHRNMTHFHLRTRAFGIHIPKALVFWSIFLSIHIRFQFTVSAANTFPAAVCYYTHCTLIFPETDFIFTLHAPSP